MKKYSCSLAVLVFSVLCSLTVFAADTWKQEGDHWYCYDKDGTKICGEWRNSGGVYYYLDPSTGAMVTGSLVADGERIYYCDEDGAKASGWRKVAVDNGTDGYEYMYFNPFSGAAQTGAARLRGKEGTAYKKYYFDDNGYMLYGFLTREWEKTDYASAAYFYYGSKEDGEAYTGWIKMEDGADTAYPEGKGHWFYFFSGGKLSNVASKEINGGYYSFDETGAMVTGWSVGTDTSAKPTLADAKYYGGEDDGRKRESEWIRAVPFDNDEEDEAWYYASDSELYAAAIRKINGKRYLFDERGKLVSGLVVTDSDGLLNRELTEKANAGIEGYLEISPAFNIMYFPEEAPVSKTPEYYEDPDTGELVLLEEDEEEEEETSASKQPSGCFRKTGKQTVTIDGEQMTVCFGKDGVALNGLNDPVEPKKLYNNGILLTAGNEIVKLVRVNLANGDKQNSRRHYFLVNVAGGVLHHKACKDADGVYWVTDGKYDILRCGDGPYADKAARSLLDTGDNQGIFYADGKRWSCVYSRETAAYDEYGERMYYKVTVKEFPIVD